MLPLNCPATACFHVSCPSSPCPLGEGCPAGHGRSPPLPEGRGQRPRRHFPARRWRCCAGPAAGPRRARAGRLFPHTRTPIQTKQNKKPLKLFFNDVRSSAEKKQTGSQTRWQPSLRGAARGRPGGTAGCGKHGLFPAGCGLGSGHTEEGSAQPHDKDNMKLRQTHIIAMTFVSANVRRMNEEGVGKEIGRSHPSSFCCRAPSHPAVRGTVHRNGLRRGHTSQQPHSGGFVADGRPELSCSHSKQAALLKAAWCFTALPAHN